MTMTTDTLPAIADMGLEQFRAHYRRRHYRGELGLCSRTDSLREQHDEEHQKNPAGDHIHVESGKPAYITNSI
jgi:hypothetical protein